MLSIVVVGAGAKVLGGFTVGDGAKVGSNAVVTKPVPAGATAVGNPARIIQAEADAKREEVASEGVMTSFFAVGGNKIELLAATRPDSPIATFIEKRGEGLHHVAYAVADLQAELDRLDAAGVALIHRHPKPGADGKMIAFVHPKSTGGTLIELCQDA